MTVLQPLRRVCFLAERYFLLLLRLYNVNCFSLVVFNYWLCVIVVVSYVSSAACFIHGVIFHFSIECSSLLVARLVMSTFPCQVHPVVFERGF